MRVRSTRDLGAAIAEARQLRGLTQEELAEATQVDRSYLARIENGRSVILLDRIFRLLRRLGVEITLTLPKAPDRGDD
jgi:transcriptional regulator with XRE-family HTH domain